MIWQTKTATLDCSGAARIMGIVNVTPDSFSDGGQFLEPEAAIAQGRRLLGEGADFLDLGGESTRPGAASISAAEELRRVLPVIQALAGEARLSIDTAKSAVARAALAAGAVIVNDVTALRGDPGMAECVRASGAGLVLMHMQGNPRTMQIAPHYDDVVAEVRAFFEERLAFAEAAGIAREQIVFDPGIGFGKTVAHNLQLLAHLDDLRVAGRPLLLGVSRKAFIGRLLGRSDLDVATRDRGTATLTSLAREKGANIFRVHAVQANLEALRMTEALLAAA